MSEFPRTMVEGVSMPRMIVGTNWFLGYSHCTKAKSEFIKEFFPDYKKIADILEVFFKAGVNAVMGMIKEDLTYYAVKEAEQRTGVQGIIVSTPSIPTDKRTALDGFDMDEVKKTLDLEVEREAVFCLPHTMVTDKMVDRCSREIRQFGPLCAAIRERGMIPGLSTHLPEAIVYADETDLDVGTYISIYNSMGFLMPIEVDWVTRLIQKAKKPVMCIKPMAAGQLRPLQGLTFVWNTVRNCDMVTVGTMTPREAQECISISLGALQRRFADVELQGTRSKQDVTPQLAVK